MSDLAKAIKLKTITFLNELEKNLNGNKAAGVRARKASLGLEKLMKEYRKQSV